MATTLARRIRRLDLTTSTYDEKGVRTHNYLGSDPNGLKIVADNLRSLAKHARMDMREGLRKARKAHRSRVANLHKKKTA